MLTKWTSTELFLGLTDGMNLWLLQGEKETSNRGKKGKTKTFHDPFASGVCMCVAKVQTVTGISIISLGGK